MAMHRLRVSVALLALGIASYIVGIIIIYSCVFCFTSGSSKYDVVIYGSTPAAITAALQTVRMGKTAAIVAPGSHIGGLTTSGLGWTDNKDGNTIGGIAREFYANVFHYYQDDSAWPFKQSVSNYAAKHINAQPGPAIDFKKKVQWTFEPHVAEEIFEDMLSEAGIPVFRNEPIVRSSTGVKIENGTIMSIQTATGRTFEASMFIDAGYDGDLMATAGVPFRVGRESEAEYGESLAGIQIKERATYNGIDPYVKKGDPSSGLIRGIEEEIEDPEAIDREADSIRLQSYNYRVTLTTNKDNRVPFYKPADYDEADYEILFRYIESGHKGRYFTTEPMPNWKTDSNAVGEVSTDLMGGNYNYTAKTNYATDSYEAREVIAQRHRSYQQGFLWTLAYHPRVPEQMRERHSKWGYAKDEFTSNNNWPYELYIRESRRMVGAYIMTQNNTQWGPATSYEGDSIAGLGCYSLDVHQLRRVVVNGEVHDDGHVLTRLAKKWYEIPYGSIIPKSKHVTNFLNPVTVSATHLALASIRMEPTYMILGQTAATAAVMAIEQGVGVQDVDREKLTARLKADHQVMGL